MRVKLVMFFCFPCVTCIFCFPTKYNQHIAMISRNLSHHPNIPLVSSQQYCEPLIGQHSPNTGLWLVIAECHCSSQKVTTTHNPGGSHHSLKNVPRVQHFMTKRSIFRDILLNILWWIILCLGGSWLTKYYNKKICKNIMSWKYPLFTILPARGVNRKWRSFQNTFNIK